MQSQDILRQTSGYQFETFADELLLYHPVKMQVICLNATAALVWNLCDGQRSVAELEELLLAAYPDQSERLRQELDEALRQLETRGLVELG